MKKTLIKVYHIDHEFKQQITAQYTDDIQNSDSISDADVIMGRHNQVHDMIATDPHKIFVILYEDDFNPCILDDTFAHSLLEVWNINAPSSSHVILMHRLLQLKKMQQQSRTAHNRASAIELASQALSHTHDEDQIFHTLVEIVAKELRSSRVSLLRVDQQLQELHMRAAHGISQEVMQMARPKIGEGIAGRCARLGKPIFIADHQRFRERTSLEELTNVEDMPMSLTIPILVRGDVVGVVNVTDRQDDQPYTQQEITFLSALMSHAGYLMESANLIQGLKDLQAFSNKVIDTLTDPLVVLNRGNEVLKSNLSYKNLFPAEISLEIEGLQDALNKDELWYQNGWKYEDYVFDLRLLPFDDDDARFLLFFQNVTERQRMGRQLVSAEKMASLGILSAGIAHEINNPLGFVKTNTKEAKRYFDDLLEIIRAWHTYAKQHNAHSDILPYQVESEVELDEIEEDVPNLIRESLDGLDRMQKIISSLKSFAHPDSEHTKESKLSTLIEHALVITQGKWKLHLKIDKNFTDDPSIFCVPNQIEQVLMNLVVNAAQAAKSRNKVEQLSIRLRSSAHHAYVEFQDTCGGIPLEVVERIFDPFFTTKDIGEGTGLGLHIAHNIIEGHGGSIHVDSQIPHGVTFKLKLPLGKKQGPLVIKQLSRFKV